jgi:type IV pilus assembly protein PilY1
MRHISIERIAFTGLMAMTLGLVPTTAARAADLALSDIPLFIELDVKPNLVVTLDDSGSMQGCGIWDQGISEADIENKSGMTSSEVNALAYNPHIEYVVPVDADNVSLGVPSFTSAWVDGYSQGSGTRNLSTSFLPCWNNLTDWRTTPLSAQIAYYHTFSGDPQNSADLNNSGLFTKIVVGSAADASLFDGQLNESNLEKQNFANWFSYYRNRLTTMKSAAGRGFVDGNLQGRIRIAYQTLWGLNADQNTRGDVSPMKQFDGQARVDFFDWLYGIQNAGGTPLRYALDKVGHYYQDQKIASTAPGHGYASMAAIDSPWAFEPGVNADPELPCRQAFHALLTDGAWNNDAGVSGNVDNTTKDYPETLASGDTKYDTAVLTAPYKDANSDTLADNAFFYWINDLRPDLANTVPPFIREPVPHPITSKIDDNPRNDPATWQHMVNFTIGFGVDGSLDFPNAYDDLLNGTQNWGTNTIDDLWHAAINSRGAYLSAKNPQQLVDVFTVTLKDVFARVSSGASVALNSASLDTNSRLYQARFDSGEWSGTVLAFDIDDVTGAIVTPEAWDAGALLTTKVQGTGWDTSRVVVTFDGTGGVPFRWASLPATMQTELNKNGEGIADAAGAEQGQARLEYLRGSEANEGAGNNYRLRSGGKLGDIVNGAPAFVEAPAFNYPDSLEPVAAYSAFRTANQMRTPMVYTGANDGMLHGFNADSGQELVAYVPRIVVPNLTRLTSKSYAHRFFVDGPPTVGDVFYSNAWHTVLVGGLRKGGQGIYALDVTDPAQFGSEATAATLVRWEFTDANDADLGYSYSRPAIARMKNGQWVAVFGNGYNNTAADGNVSTFGNAVLFIVDIETGALIKKIDTGAGMAADPSGNSRPNGLATASPVDVDGDRIIDYIYAGDLFGNLWKFNVTSSDPNAWGVAYAGDPLFVATDATGTPQPITTRPEVGFHPVFKTGSAVFANGGYMIYFGTGQYIETGDNKTTNVQTQTFYGIWDPDRATLPPSFDRAHLLEQQIEGETTVTIGSEDFDVRLTSNNNITWRDDPLVDAGGDMGWFMDLINIGASPAVNNGERQVTESILRPDGRIVFTTLIPSGSSCEFGGSGFLMELDVSDGSRLSDPPFDFDNDGVFDTVDNGFGVNVAPGGVRSRSGAPATPGILPAANQREEYKYLSGTDAGKIDIIHESATAGSLSKGTRESWRQLQ